MKKLSLLLLVVAGCAKSGMGEAVRTDITMQMETIRPTVADCYKAALRDNRKLRGLIVVEFRAAATSGVFEGVQIVRDDLSNPTLQKCVVEAVGGLKLATPQKTAVSVTYPLDFAPTK